VFYVVCLPVQLQTTVISSSRVSFVIVLVSKSVHFGTEQSAVTLCGCEGYRVITAPVFHFVIGACSYDYEV